MKLKHFVKKYTYLFKTNLRSFSNKFVKKNLYYFSDVDPSNLSPLEVEKLTYPVKWRKYSKFDTINVELGTGHGELLSHLSKKNPDDLFVGFEITKTYSLKTRKKIKEQSNAFIFKADGYTVTLDLFADRSINRIYILFPDPWHKKRHHKRRPVNSGWLKSVYNKLERGGEIFFATDWNDYYVHVLEQLKSTGEMYKIKSGVYLPSQFGLIETHYYKKWKEMGRNFKYIRMIK